MGGEGWVEKDGWRRGGDATGETRSHPAHCIQNIHPIRSFPSFPSFPADHSSFIASIRAFAVPVRALDVVTRGDFQISIDLFVDPSCLTRSFLTRRRPTALPVSCPRWPRSRLETFPRPISRERCVYISRQWSCFRHGCWVRFLDFVCLWDVVDALIRYETFHHWSMGACRTSHIAHRTSDGDMPREPNVSTRHRSPVTRHVR